LLIVLAWKKVRGVRKTVNIEGELV
jgi:hypothetical protein